MATGLKRNRKLPRGVKVTLQGPRTDWSDREQEIAIRRERKWNGSYMYDYLLTVGCEDLRLSEEEVLDMIALLQQARRLA